MRRVAAGQFPVFAQHDARVLRHDQHGRHAERMRHFEIARQILEQHGLPRIDPVTGEETLIDRGVRLRLKLGRLDVEYVFEDIFDIKSAELEPKPNAAVYERFLARHRVDPRQAVLFEDLARNLEVPHALGMTTVLVVPQGARVVLREDWELTGRDAPHVDHVTDDLAGFLREIAAAMSPT